MKNEKNSIIIKKKPSYTAPIKMAVSPELTAT